MSARKPLPYAAGALLDDAMMALADARRQVRRASEASSKENLYQALTLLAINISEATTAIQQAKGIRE